jgi:hypothetical protein
VASHAGRLASGVVALGCIPIMSSRAA